MLNRNTNERVVCASYNDELGGWKYIEKELRAQMPKGMPLKFVSNLGTPINCDLVNIKFLNEKTLSADQLTPTTDSIQDKTKKTMNMPKPVIDPFANAHEKPFLRIYLTIGEDYKGTIKPKVSEWIKSLGEHDEWLIIHLSSKESGFFQRTVASSLKSEFAKGKIDRICTFKMFDTDRNTNMLDDVMAKIRDGIARSGQRMISEYSARMKSLESERNSSSFNFMNFFALKEGLAFVYEALKLPSTALGIYDELETLFGQRDLEIWRVRFLSFGGDQIGDDSGSLLDFGKKPYRQMLLSNSLTEFDFRQYLFARQCHLLFAMNMPSQVLSRGIKFISNFEVTMLKNGLSKMFTNVWCFSSYMDIAESCKASSQSSNSDPQLSYILGDVYFSAISKLDALGADFNLLPNESLFISSEQKMKPYGVDFWEETEEFEEYDDTDTQSNFDPEQHNSVSFDELKALEDFEKEKNELLKQKEQEQQQQEQLQKEQQQQQKEQEQQQQQQQKEQEQSSSQESTPLPESTNQTHQNSTHETPQMDVHQHVSGTSPHQDKPQELNASTEEKKLSSSQEQPQSPTDIVSSDDLDILGEDTDPSALDQTNVPEVPGMPIQDDSMSPSADASLEINPSESSLNESNQDQNTANEIQDQVAADDSEIQNPTNDSSDFQDQNASNVEQEEGKPQSPIIQRTHLSSQNDIVSPLPIIAPIPFSIQQQPPNLPVKRSDSSDTLKPRDSSGHSRKPSNKSFRPTHSRSSSIGESIDLDYTEDVYDDDQVDIQSSDNLSRPEIQGLVAVTQDSDGPLPTSVSSYPELQMAILSILNSPETRETLSKSLHLSEADHQLFLDSSSGAVFSLSYLQAAFLSDDAGINSLISIIEGEKSLSKLLTPLLEYQSSRNKLLNVPKTVSTPSKGFSKSISQSPSSSSIHASPLENPQASPAKSSSLFSFTTTVATAEPIPVVPKISLSSIGTDHSNTAPNSASSSVSTLTPSSSRPVTPRKSRSRRFGSMGKIVLESNEPDSPAQLSVEGFTITHPSLSSALSDPLSFDKLYKSIAFKSNAAFSAVKRNRSATRIKTALGNLLFSRGHFNEVLKQFDDELIGQYISEGWDKLLFSLYNKIAECYRQLGKMSEYCSSLLCLLAPRVSSFCTVEQRQHYQREFEDICKKLPKSLPISVDTKDDRDKLLSTTLNILDPSSKKANNQETYISTPKEISMLPFSMDDTIHIRAHIVSHFPSPFKCDKVILTFQAVNRKSRKTRAFNMAIENAIVAPGKSTLHFASPMNKGRWFFTSYTFKMGKLTITTRYNPSSGKTSLSAPTSPLYLVVKKSATTASISMTPPTYLVLNARQYLNICLAANDDEMKDVVITISADKDTVAIPDAHIRDAELCEACSEQDSNGVNQDTPEVTNSTSSTPENTTTSTTSSTSSTTSTSSSSTDSSQQKSFTDVIIKNHVISLPNLHQKSLLNFHLPIMATSITHRGDGQLESVFKDITFDITYRKPSGEKKAVSTQFNLAWNSPLLFSHHNIYQPGSHTFLSSIIVKNQSPIMFHLKSYMAHTIGDIIVSQDYNSALGTDQVKLQSGDYSTILLALTNTSLAQKNRLERRNSNLGSGFLPASMHERQIEEKPQWMELTVSGDVFSDAGPFASIPVKYSYVISFEYPSPTYHVDMRYDKPMIVGNVYPLDLGFFRLNSPRTSSPSFSAFYRLMYDPAQWIVMGKTYSHIPLGSSQVKLGIIPLAANVSAPHISIEEFSNKEDSSTKTIVPACDITMSYSHDELEIIPKQRVTSVCREVDD